MAKLKVYWIPNLDETFEFLVESIEQARSCLDLLAEEDLKHPFIDCNVGGLLEFFEEDDEWVEWTNEMGYTIDEFENDIITPDKSLNVKCFKAYKKFLREMFSKV